MSDRPENSREFLTEFIELYKSLPCLWHPRSKQYRDKAVINKAYELMVHKYREVLPKATKQNVKSKINILRTTYRKVLGKVNQSIQSGATGDEVYRPSLWYFHLFDFLRDLEPQNADRSMRTYTLQVKNQETVQYEDDESDERYSSDPFANASYNAMTVVPKHKNVSSASQRAHIVRNKRHVSQQFEEQWGQNDEMLSEEDAFDLYGRHIANKLRSLPAQQNVFAQKLINDVLFEAEMVNLSRGCKIVNESLP